MAPGSTPLPLYRELIKREKEGEIDFSRVCSTNLDEYKGLAPDHPQSHRKFMQDNLLDHISIKPESTIVPLGLAEDVQAMCEVYEAQIEQWGGVDLQLRGSRKIVMVITGEDKKDISRKTFWGPVDPQVPASTLQFRPDVFMICDEAAYPR